MSLGSTEPQEWFLPVQKRRHGVADAFLRLRDKLRGDLHDPFERRPRRQVEARYSCTAAMSRPYRLICGGKRRSPRMKGAGLAGSAAKPVALLEHLAVQCICVLDVAECANVVGRGLSLGADVLAASDIG